ASLDPAVAGLILDAVPVRRVAFADGDGASATVRSAWSVAEDSPRVMPIDARRLATAMSERAGVIVNMDGANVLVAPMMAFGRATGVVWAEASRGVDLDERHLGLLLVIAALAAVAREQAHEAARLEDTNERLRAEINLEHNMVGTSRPMRQLFDRI